MSKQKTKHFWKDSDGFSIADMEKVVLAFLLVSVVVSILYMWIFKDTESSLINDLAYAIGGLFVLRKGLSYFKKDGYYLEYQSAKDKKDEESY